MSIHADHGGGTAPAPNACGPRASLPMDKITDKIAALPVDAEYFSLEFFPPKTAMGFSNLRHRLQRMQQALRPLFVNVTWGAGGSTATKSLELAELCQRELGLTTCLHLTCTNMSRLLVDRALEDAKALGIRNILALRGDPPRGEDYHDPSQDGSNGGWGEFAWAVDLVRYIRRHHGDYFCIGIAAYPEGYADGSYAVGQCLERDLPSLVEKTQAGADFIMTQLFFDIEVYARFEKTLREHPSGAFKSIPIIPGLMPIQSYQMIKRTTKLSHAKIPVPILARLDAVKGDDEQVKRVGVDVISELVEKIRTVKEDSSPGPAGFHFYTLNLEKAVSFIIERTGLIPEASEKDDDVLIEDLSLHLKFYINGKTPLSTRSHSRSSRRLSSAGSDPHNRVIVASRHPSHPEWEATGQDAAIPAESVNTRANTLAISEGEGVLGREATWDDFPNGRFGDARSPAYGEIDGYGVSLHMSFHQAMRLWGHPTSLDDISDIFVKHVRGELKAIPWSEEELMPESSTIQPALLKLNGKGWWTVASQPAVNSVSSTDPLFGWGPPNGFVFQKSFVEFFLPAKDWRQLLDKLRSPEVASQVCFYAANARGDFLSSDAAGTAAAAAAPRASTNAVTWGVFLGKEIVTPTIIEEVSFRAWSEEAFGIWREWGAVYGCGSDSEKLLTGVREDYWLVNVIHHDFVDKDALWRLLTE